MRAPSPNNDGMGSLLTGATCRFRVWAPNASRVQVVLTDPTTGPTFELAPEGSSGNWSADGIPAVANTKYQYIITNRGGPNNDNSQPWLRTDACAVQVESSSPQSMGYVVGPFPSNRQPFTTPSFENLLIYQLHVGSFSGLNDGVTAPTPTATFVSLIDKLDYIRNLGFNAVELLPISDFRADLAGAGEGYGPSDMFASENLYATSPDRAVQELLDLVDAAHSKGLAIILDVVYNHAGIDHNRYWRYDGNFAGDNGILGGIYHVHGYHTPWGEGFALWQREVKDFLLDNARMYLRDYKVDGLRFDAVQAMQSDAVSFIVQTLRREFPDKYLIAEYNPSDASTSASGAVDPYAYLGFCATWDMNCADDTFALLNGNNVVDLLLRHIGNFSDPNQWHSVAYLTGSHDQVYGGQSHGGRYITERFGGRTNGYARAKARLAWTLTATLPATPMLFMGTEGHLDGFWDPVVGPGYDHRINWLEMGNDLGAPMQRMVTDINNLRWNHSGLRSPNGQITHVDRQNGVVAMVINAGDSHWNSNQYGVSLAGDYGSWHEIFNSQAPIYGGVNTVGNPGYTLEGADGQLWLNLPSWAVLILQKQ